MLKSFRSLIPLLVCLMGMAVAAERNAGASSESMGTLYLRGVPSGATVTVNEVPVHKKISEPIVLSPGSVQVRIVAEGTQTLKSFVLKAGEVKILNVGRNPDHASVDVISDPLGADVVIDDQVRGKTPFLDSLVDPGFHVIAIKKYGYDPVIKEVNLLPQEELELTIDLTRSKAWLDSVARAKALKRKKRQSVTRLVFSTLGIACAGAAGYFDLTAQKNIHDADALAQTYDRARDGFDALRVGYYDHRNAAQKNIKYRDMAAALAGGMTFGVLLSFVF